MRVCYALSGNDIGTALRQRNTAAQTRIRCIGRPPIEVFVRVVSNGTRTNSVCIHTRDDGVAALMDTWIRSRSNNNTTHRVPHTRAHTHLSSRPDQTGKYINIHFVSSRVGVVTMSREIARSSMSL